MGVIIKEIKISNDSYTFISENGSEENILKNLSKINIFIGENNSGKSRFMRSLIYKSRNECMPEFIPNNNDFTIIKEGTSNLKKEIRDYIGEDSAIEFSAGNLNLRKFLSNIKEFDYIIPNFDYIKPLIALEKFLDKLKKVDDRYLTIHMSERSVKEGTLRGFTSGLSKIFDESFNDLNKELKTVGMHYSLNKIYIPILRGLRDINQGQDIYSNRTIRDYFDNLDEDYLKDNHNIEIFTGLKIYKSVKNLLLGDLSERKLIREFEEYLSKQFYDNQPIALIPKERDNDRILTIKIGNEQEMPIYDLGDGIQSIIALTLPLFLQGDISKDQNILVSIEEPENLLHPSLQRKLIQTFFDERFENYQFFFTTHSNHFLDVVLDFDGISLYTVNKKLNGNTEEELANFVVKNVSFGDNNLLNLLGVRNSSVFLPNCNIWVEGISDVLYFRDYLDIYQEYKKNEDNNFKKFTEDLHYSFYKYDGSDVNTLLSLKLNENDKKLERIFLIRDYDDPSDENKKKKDESLKKGFVETLFLVDLC